MVSPPGKLKQHIKGEQKYEKCGLASHGAKIAFMDFKIGCEPTFFVFLNTLVLLVYYILEILILFNKIYLPIFKLKFCNDIHL